MSQWNNPEGYESFSGRGFENPPYNRNRNERQVVNGLPPANWQPPSAHFQGPPSGVAFHAPPHIEPPSYAHPHRTQSPQAARETHGLPIWVPNQQTAHAHSLGYRITDDNAVAASRDDDFELHRVLLPDPDEDFIPVTRFPGTLAAGMPNSSAHSTQADLTRRLEEMEERSEEEQKQRLRLESKVDENAQTLVDILKELKALRPQVAAPANLAAGVNLNNAIPAVSNAPNAPHHTNSVTQQHAANRSLTMGDSIEAHQQTGQVQNDATEEPNNTADGVAVRASKRPVQPAQAGNQAAESSKRAKTAHPNTAGTNKSDSGSSPSSSTGAHSTAVFQLRAEVEQQQQQQADSAEESSEPSTPVEAATIPAPSSISNNDPDLRWAREFLDYIKRMDCTSDRELLSLKKCAKGRVSFDFPLCTDSPTRRTKFCYFLKVGGSLSTPLSPNPGNRPPQPGPDREEVENLNVYETYHDQRCAAATNSAFRAYHPPKYVAPLGEVYRACRSTDGPGEVASTNFFVFMDVASPRKSVWLMYRYEKAVEDRDRVKWQPVSIHGERDSVFSSGVRPFDALCLLEDVRDWKGPAEDMIGMGRFEQALPENGQVVLRAAFYTPVLEKLREAMKKGWEPAVDDEEE